MDDDGLIARVALVTTGRFRELFFRHAPWLAARLRVVLPAVDVEDVLQETFLGVVAGGRPATDRWDGGRVAVGDRPTPGGPCSCAAEDRERLILPARVASRSGRRRGLPTGSGAVANGLRERGGRIGPSGRAGPGDVAAVVRRGPVGIGGCPR